MTKLTSRERLMRIFQNREIDRPALKLWGANLGMTNLLHPSYAPICQLAEALSDLCSNAGSPFHIYCGMMEGQVTTYTVEKGVDPRWNKITTVYHTPKGPLTQVTLVSVYGETEHALEYAVKEPEDLEKLLSLPYQPYPVDPEPFFKENRRLGEKGIAMFPLDHAGYALQRLTGSENLAYLSIDCRELVEEVIGVFADRILEHVKSALAAGVQGVFSWVGPEVFLPPLMSPKDFDDFVYRFDKPICDAIHAGGSYVWVHCHGKVANFLQRYIDMGVDVLNPLEVPKNGDVDLEACIRRYGNQIGWEGNIEIQDIIQGEPDALRESIRQCVDAGRKSGRFLLCPSAGFMEYPFPEERYLQNLRIFLEEGYRQVTKG